jgi:hypothetical protein
MFQIFSRKGATAQRRRKGIKFLKVGFFWRLLCAFAPLREKSSGEA